MTPMQLAAERNNMDIVEILREATGEELPDDVKLKQLSNTMYLDDREEAKTKFSKLLGSLSPELVSSQLIKLYLALWLNDRPTRREAPLSIQMVVYFNWLSLKAKLNSLGFY